MIAKSVIIWKNYSKRLFEHTPDSVSDS